MIQGTGILIPPSDFLTGELVAPAGTRLSFNQTTPPVGWTTDASASFTDCTNYIKVANAGTAVGGTVWSSWNFGGTFNANGFTLSTAQLPSHNHSVSDPGHTMTAQGGNFWGDFATGGGLSGGTSNIVNSGTSNTDAAFTGLSVSNSGSGATITPSITTPQVKYTDFVIGVRS